MKFNIEVKYNLLKYIRVVDALSRVYGSGKQNAAPNPCSMASSTAMHTLNFIESVKHDISHAKVKRPTSI